MGRGKSSIADELVRNRVGGRYDPRKAHHKAYVRRKYAKYQGMRIVGTIALRDEVESRLMDGQSPEAVAQRISRHERHLPSLSKNAVYRYLKSPYGGSIAYHRLRKRRRRAGRARTAHLKNRTFIDKRPQYINARRRMGDVEADFIVSGKTGRGILLTVADRRSRTTYIEQIIRVTIPNVHRAFVRIRERFPELRTVTTDNDLLFAHHGALARLLGVRIFFCHPYHSWEKGSIEHMNGVIRRDVPKGSDLSRYSKRFLRTLEAKLNRRPMKLLGYRTPQEILDAYRTRIKKQKRPIEGCPD